MDGVPASLAVDLDMVPQAHTNHEFLGKLKKWEHTEKNCPSQRTVFFCFGSCLLESSIFVGSASGEFEEYGQTSSTTVQGIIACRGTSDLVQGC